MTLCNLLKSKFIVYTGFLVNCYPFNRQFLLNVSELTTGERIKFVNKNKLNKLKMEQRFSRFILYQIKHNIEVNNVYTVYCNTFVNEYSEKYILCGSE